MKTKPKLVTIQYRRRGDHSKGNTWKDHATVRPRVGRGFIAFHERNECAREWRIKPDLMVQYRVRHAYFSSDKRWKDYEYFKPHEAADFVAFHECQKGYYEYRIKPRA